MQVQPQVSGQFHATTATPRQQLNEAQRHLSYSGKDINVTAGNQTPVVRLKLVNL
jgi:hypothetical protein